MADFNIDNVIGLNRIIKVVDIGEESYYILQPTDGTLFMEKVVDFDNKYSKKVALAKIEEQVAILKTALRTAQKLADEHSLKFSIDIDLPEGSNPNSDYGNRTVAGKYVGKGSESYKDEVYPTEGHWYWENSSLNC